MTLRNILAAEKLTASEDPDPRAGEAVAIILKTCGIQTTWDGVPETSKIPIPVGMASVMKRCWLRWAFDEGAVEDVEQVFFEYEDFNGHRGEVILGTFSWQEFGANEEGSWSWKTYNPSKSGVVR